MARSQPHLVAQVNVLEDAGQETEGAALERGEGDVDEGDVPGVEGVVRRAGDCAELEAGAEDADEGEDYEEAPAVCATEAVANCQEDGESEGGDVGC